ncbi:LOB domain-containing protein 16-like [Andrographis paniculata]|uniref:LOB domain-containing protein 16-like n=1 Tax=Andrographis paniculata TaxID=175694 RepID=UPI0021E73B4D|nr:LOB domain-containing protein 16-like [Andrographis paniculata]
MATGSPCGACKFLRRKCAAECIFAPYFCSEQGAARFAAIHKVFGASNVSKLLLHVPVPDRCEAVVTIAYEAQARIRDPVYGCVAHIFALQQQVAYLQAQVMQAKSQLAQNLLVMDHHHPQSSARSISCSTSTTATTTTTVDDLTATTTTPSPWPAGTGSINYIHHQQQASIIPQMFQSSNNCSSSSNYSNNISPQSSFDSSNAIHESDCNDAATILPFHHHQYHYPAAIGKRRQNNSAAADDEMSELQELALRMMKNEY